MGQSLQRVAAQPVSLPHLTNVQNDEFSSLLISNHEEAEDQLNEKDAGKFPDLSNLPPELAMNVLKNLNATDLCLASCVWQQLASDNILWQGLCRSH